MGLLDRFLNPLWHQIDQLDDARKADICALIGIVGYVRASVDEVLVGAFEQFCEKTSSASLRLGGKLIIPLDRESRARMVDEAALALLCSCRRAQSPTGTLNYIDPSALPDVIGAIVLAEINHRLNRNKPTTVDETGYSKDAVESGTQLLLTWMRILGLTDPSMIGVVRTAFFDKEWASCTTGFLVGCLKGLMRVERSVLFQRARADCAGLSPTGKALVELAVSKLAASQ